MRSKKVLLISIVLILLVLVEVKSVFAIDITNQTNTNTATNTATNAQNISNPVANNTVANVGASTNSTYNTSTNTNRANTANKVNTSSSDKLPHAGSDPTIIFAILGLTLSAIYAYKKVSDYNIKL